MRSVASVLVALGVICSRATAGPAHYPYRLHTVTDAEKTKRAAAFRKRNPQHWSDLVIDSYGHVTYAVTDDPKLGSASVDGLKAFARRNADFFDMTPDEVDRLAPLPHGGGYEILDQVDGINLGQIVLGRGSKQPMLFVNASFFVDVAPKVGADELVQRFAGKTYTVETTYTNPGIVDCALVGGTPCPPEVVATERRNVTLAAADVPVVTRLRLDGDELRLVRCVDLTALQPYPDATKHHARSWSRRYTPTAGADPVPFAIDAVTGEELHAGASCDANRFR